MINFDEITGGNQIKHNSKWLIDNRYRVSILEGLDQEKQSHCLI